MSTLRADVAALREAVESADFQVALVTFVAGLTEKAQAYWAQHYANLKPPTFTQESGPKYVRIVRNEGQGSGRSVYCFIDKSNGDILKPASWKAPAKHPRGNILGSDPFAGTGPYGVAYLKGGLGASW